MGLAGFIIGGALGGAGKAMQLQQEDDVVARREARLAALRAEERKEDRANTLENFTIEEEANARSQLRGAKIAEAADNRKAASLIGIAEKEAAAAKEKDLRDEQRLYRVETFRKKLDIVGERAKAGIAAAYEKGEIQDVLETEGGVTMLYKDGKKQFVPLTLREEKPKEGSESLLEKAGGGAPKATATTPPKSPDQTPTVEDGYRYTPGPGGRANQSNWTKA